MVMPHTEQVQKSSSGIIKERGEEKMDITEDTERLKQVSRDTYIKVYHLLGKDMFSNCYIPNVSDIADIYKGGSTDKLENISAFTGNTKDILASIKRTDALYTDAESDKFIRSVIASNSTDITKSGYFYKKLMSATDDMKVVLEDCGSAGVEMPTNITEEEFNYKVLFHWVNELGKYIEDYSEYKTCGLDTVHVRTVLSCTATENHKCFCKKCVGIYKREKNSHFVPYNIGQFATLQITEHATQASLDSMNNGISKPINSILEENFSKEKFKTYDDVVRKVNTIVDSLAGSGVESRYYELALLSRVVQDGKKYKFVSLQSVQLKTNDELGKFIYRPTKTNFEALVNSKPYEITSSKTKIMLDLYQDS